MKKPVLVKPDGSPVVPTFSPAQQQCIEILQDSLESALRGDVHSLVLVACGPNDFGIAIGGSDAPRLNLGLDVAKRTILDRTSK